MKTLILSLPFLLAFLSENANIFASAQDEIPEVKVDQTFESDLCCNEESLWTPFYPPGNRDKAIWGWRYCCVSGTKPKEGTGCDKSKNFKIGRGKLSNFIGGRCGADNKIAYYVWGD